MSENHIRAISTTLSLLDEAVCEFEAWSKGHEIRSVLYEVRNELSSEQRHAISAEIAEIQTMLRKLRDELHLDGHVKSVEKMIIAACTVMWINLTELERKHLRRYGDVPPELAEYLDPKVAELNRRVQHISDIVTRRWTR